jgi:hypothetical protein
LLAVCPERSERITIYFCHCETSVLCWLWQSLLVIDVCPSRVPAPSAARGTRSPILITCLAVIWYRERFLSDMRTQRSLLAVCPERSERITIYFCHCETSVLCWLWQSPPSVIECREWFLSDMRTQHSLLDACPERSEWGYPERSEWDAFSNLYGRSLIPDSGVLYPGLLIPDCSYFLIDQPL